MAVDDLHLEPAPAELWRHANPKSTAMWKFLERVNSAYNLDLHDYPSLYKWSIENVDKFWYEVWHYVGVKSSVPFTEVSQMFRETLLEGVL
jgi:acetoacetyl-CoA synthetase